jgi:DNA-binding NarL/FixJ family response regulator
MSIRVVIADDHPLSLAGLAAALESDGLRVVGRASNGIAAIAQIKAQQPECAVLDLSMPGASGLDVLIEARRWSPGTRIVVLTGLSAAETLREVADAGAEAIFLKSAPVEAITDAVRRVARGETLHGEAVRHILDRSDDAQKLTARERQVLTAIARGLTNQGASEVLGISAKTVDTHRTNLMRKLGVNSTATLLVRAMRDGLIDLSDTE